MSRLQLSIRVRQENISRRGLKRIRREKKFWDTFAGRYDKFMNRFAGAYSDLVTLMVSDLNRNDEILEVATGTGIVALAIGDKVTMVDAVDISRPMIAVAVEKAKSEDIRNVRFSVQDCYSLSYGDARFDACIIANTLHVLMEPESALIEIRRVLKTDGIVIAPTYCHGENLKTRMISLIMRFSGFRVYHKFTISSFVDFFETNGFSVVKKRVLKEIVPLVYLVARPR